jgi:hypothetical protein
VSDIVVPKWDYRQQFLATLIFGRLHQPGYPREVVFECDVQCLRIYGKMKLFEEISEYSIFHGITV